jgi:hypothetical protein
MEKLTNAIQQVKFSLEDTIAQIDEYQRDEDMQLLFAQIRGMLMQSVRILDGKKENISKWGTPVQQFEPLELNPRPEKEEKK